MRVQFRDRNPPRGTVWRYGRGRGKYSQYGPPHHYTDSVGIVSQEASLEKNIVSEQHLGADSTDLEKATPILISYPTLLEHPTNVNRETLVPSGSSGRFENAVASGADSHLDNEQNRTRVRTPDHTAVDYPRSRQSSPKFSSHYEGHEWNQDTNTSAPVTTSPSSYASSVSATAPSIPYPVPNMGFYQPQWMQPLPQQFPYAMPFVQGYAGYPLSSHQPMSRPFGSPSGSDSSGQSSAVQVPYGGMFPVCYRISLSLCSSFR